MTRAADELRAQDGTADQIVDCGVGTDSGEADASDFLANCENVTQPALPSGEPAPTPPPTGVPTPQPVVTPDPDDKDGDGDLGFLGDCNDADPTVGPNAPEVRGDGIDQNCDGTDLPYLRPACFPPYGSASTTSARRSPSWSCEAFPRERPTS